MYDLTSKIPTEEQIKYYVPVTELIKKMALIINEETMENQVLHEAKSNCAKADGTSLFSKQPQKKPINKILYCSGTKYTYRWLAVASMA
jgi:hypothetical protein